MKTHYKLASHLALFILFFSLISLVFFPLGKGETPDSYSYTYLIRGLGYVPDIQRPIVYPVYLLILDLLGRNKFYYDSLFLVSNYMILALTFLMIYNFLLKTKVNKLFIFVSIIFVILNFQITQWGNIVGPEILLQFFLAFHLICVYNYFRSPSLKNNIIVAVSFLLLSFTKPITLYYPVLFVLFILAFTNAKRNLKLVKNLGLILLIYLTPVIFWIAGNGIKNGIYTFSIIKNVNLTGKVIQYSLAEPALRNSQFLPLKKYLPNEASKIWRLFELDIAIVYGLPFYNYIHDFSLYAISLNPWEFIKKSALLIPELAADKPLLTDSKYCSFRNYIVIYPQTKVCSYMPTRLYLEIYSFAFKIFEKISFSPVLIFIIFAKSLFIIRQKTFRKTEELMFLYTTLSFVFFLAIISLSAYEQYSRIRAPLDFLWIMVIFTILSFLWSLISKKVKGPLLILVKS